METIGISIEVEKPFGNLYRPSCVLIALGTHTGQVLVGAKADFLPPGITRLLGGGVNEGEGINLAALREVKEETGISILSSRLVPLFTLQTAARDAGGATFLNETHVFFASIGDASYVPSDDVSEIIPLSVTELYELGEQYSRMQDYLWYRKDDKEFRWSDYGKMYSLIHKKTAEKLKDLM